MRREVIQRSVDEQREREQRRKELGASLVAQLPFFTVLGLQDRPDIIMALGRRVCKPIRGSTRTSGALQSVWIFCGPLPPLASGVLCARVRSIDEIRADETVVAQEIAVLREQMSMFKDVLKYHNVRTSGSPFVPSACALTF